MVEWRKPGVKAWRSHVWLDHLHSSFLSITTLGHVRFFKTGKVIPCGVCMGNVDDSWADPAQGRHSCSDADQDVTSLPGTVFHTQRQEVHDPDQNKEDRVTTVSARVAIGNSSGSLRRFTRHWTICTYVECVIVASHLFCLSRHSSYPF